MSFPEYLYHYTNVESLALILKNKTLRLNSLDKMDDLQEKETGDLKNISSMCLVSSWTEDSVEQIPMWKMYTNPYSGVRIRMPSLPFKTYHKDTTIDEYFSHVNQIGIPNEVPIDPYDMIKRNYFALNLAPRLLLRKIEYTNEKEKLYPTLLKSDGKSAIVTLSDLGIYKNTYWQFQKEWRYTLHILPFDFSKHDNKEVIARTIARMQLGIFRPVFSYYDLHFAEEAFRRMEITLSPQISVGNRVIVQSLIDKYNPFATLRESDLLGLI